ncbi:MAG: hypothetical protein ABFC34_10810 [Methanobacterium sp.]
MIHHEPKFKINDTVRTNSLYTGIFPEKNQFQGVVREIESISLTDRYNRVIEVVQMVTVDGVRINQDYFDKVE